MPPLLTCLDGILDDDHWSIVARVVAWSDLLSSVSVLGLPVVFQQFNVSLWKSCTLQLRNSCEYMRWKTYPHIKRDGRLSLLDQLVGGIRAGNTPDQGATTVWSLAVKPWNTWVEDCETPEIHSHLDCLLLIDDSVGHSIGIMSKPVEAAYLALKLIFLMGGKVDVFVWKHQMTETNASIYLRVLP